MKLCSNEVVYVELTRNSRRRIRSRRKENQIFFFLAQSSSTYLQRLCNGLGPVGTTRLSSSSKELEFFKSLLGKWQSKGSHRLLVLHPFIPSVVRVVAVLAAEVLIWGLMLDTRRRKATTAAGAPLIVIMAGWLGWTRREAAKLQNFLINWRDEEAQ